MITKHKQDFLSMVLTLTSIISPLIHNKHLTLCIFLELCRLFAELENATNQVFKSMEHFSDFTFTKLSDSSKGTDTVEALGY